MFEIDRDARADRRDARRNNEPRRRVVSRPARRHQLKRTGNMRLQATYNRAAA